MATQSKDPVCGMNINPNQSKHKTEYQGKQYNFCSSECMEKFKKSPNQYRGKS
jgi:YHS domain-containing protein